ncbi:MAG: rod shape-determining protein MreD [Pseudomonadota bacterium]
MQSAFSSARILLPAKPWFIAVSLLLSLLLNLLPTRQWPGMPDCVALVLIFWSMHEHRRVGMGWAFLLGLAMDVADANLLGQHALAYVLASYVAATLARRILWFPLSLQALHILVMLLAVQLIQLCVRMSLGADFPGVTYFFGAMLGAVLWIPLNYLLLLPQYQPVEHDDNRPI